MEEEETNKREETNPLEPSTEVLTSPSDNFESLHRARLFILENNDWSEIGTGFCEINLVPATTNLSNPKELEIPPDLEPAAAVDEVCPKVLQLRLRSELDPDRIVCQVEIPNDKSTSSRQQETVIAWKTEDGRDAAISMETIEGCDELWQMICEFQQKGSQLEDAFLTIEQISKVALPESVDFGTLSEIEATLQSSLTHMASKKNMIAYILDHGYIPRLLDLFRIAEDLENLPALHQIFLVFRLFVLFNSPMLFKELLEDHYVIHVAGVFEYPLSCTDVKDKNNYRAFLNDSSKFKEIVKIDDESFLKLIHSTFHAQYFQDVVLPKILDEESFATFSMLIRSNHSEILSFLDTSEANDTEKPSENYFTKLSSLFVAEDEPICLQLCKFFKELLYMCKTSMKAQKLGFFQSEGFNLFLAFLTRQACKDGTVRPLAIEILMSLAQFDVTLLRDFITTQETVDISEQGQPKLLSTLIDIFIYGGNIGFRWHIVAILRLLLDTPTPGVITTSVSSADQFIGQFYPNYATNLFLPLIDLHKSIASKSGEEKLDVIDPIHSDLYFNLCELLCCFVIQHKYRIKYMLLRTCILQNVVILFRSREAYLRLAALRVIRTLVGVSDEFYHRLLIKHSILAKLLQLFKDISARNSLLTCALLEFFDYIGHIESRILLNHLAENHRTTMEELSQASCQVFIQLLNNYDKGKLKDNDVDDVLEREQHFQYRGNWSGVDYHEEEYFSSANDEEDYDVQF